MITIGEIASLLNASPKGEYHSGGIVNGIAMDSRQVQKDWVFVAIKGTRVDGHDFVQQVLSLKPSLIIAEKAVDAGDVPVIYVKDASIALGKVASAFYGNPSAEMQLVGITGTNGKTTVATLLYDLFKALGYRVGLLSTVKIMIHDRELPSTHTTPDATAINRVLREMRDAGCDYCFMECSSHAIDQNRIAGLEFKGGVFTNITHDHLDYHQTFNNYLAAKKKFFDKLDRDAFALTNKDDRNGQVMLQNTKAGKYSYGLTSIADFHARIKEMDFNGMLLEIDNKDVWFRLIGKFNAYNLLAVYGTAFLLGMDREEVIHQLSKLSGASGRFEKLISSTGRIGIVDYAHTPDALKNILQVVNEIRTKNEELITIIGCGGDRDKEKRPVMAAIAAEMSTKAIFTSDNPRSEDPEEILKEMEAGVQTIHYKKTLKITDRKEAIKSAVSMSRPGDIVLIAGKGHETYQEIKGEKHPFDDKAILKEMFEKFKD